MVLLAHRFGCLPGRHQPPAAGCNDGWRARSGAPVALLERAVLRAVAPDPGRADRSPDAQHQGPARPLDRGDRVLAALGVGRLASRPSRHPGQRNDGLVNLETVRVAFPATRRAPARPLRTSRTRRRRAGSSSAPLAPPGGRGPALDGEDVAGRILEPRNPEIPRAVDVALTAEAR